MIYREFGLGFGEWFTTEIESGDQEVRINGWIDVDKIDSIYVRICLLGWSFILDSRDGMKMKKKSSNVKILLGLRSE